MAYQIFISYRRSGGEALAYLINERLTAAGYKVFYDLESLTSGKFNTKLLEVIDTCDDVLVILPPNSLERCINEDDWLRQEIAHALKKEKNLIPVMMKGFEWPEELPEDIQEIKNYNGVTVSFDFFDGVMARIVKGLTTNIRNNRKGYEGKFKHILLWGDFDDANLEKIVRKLKLDAEYYVEILEDPVEILSKNLGEIDTIVLIITDCTKLSNNEFALKRLNEGLVDFVRQGGRLVCTHDVIYRRTRNELLQNMFGCKITNFRQSNEVVYIKTEECRDSDVFTSLNDRFILHDAEICWGNIADDVDVFFKTEDDIPLVFAREYGSGICVYLNPGDFKERPPRSILKPEKEFVDLLRESIYLQY